MITVVKLAINFVAVTDILSVSIVDFNEGSGWLFSNIVKWNKAVLAKDGTKQGLCEHAAMFAVPFWINLCQPSPFSSSKYCSDR